MVGSQEVGIYSFSFSALVGFVLVETFIYLVIYIFIYLFACLLVYLFIYLFSTKHFTLIMTFTYMWLAARQTKLTTMYRI